MQVKEGTGLLLSMTYALDASEMDGDGLVCMSQASSMWKQVFGSSVKQHIRLAHDT